MDSDEFYRVIGMVTLHSSDAHAVLCRVRLLSDGEIDDLDSIRKLMLKDPVSRCEDLIEKLAKTEPDQELRGALDTLVLLSRGVRDERNLITHALWPWNAGDAEPLATRLRVETFVSGTQPDTSVWESVAEGLARVAFKGRQIVHYMDRGTWIS